MSLDSRNEILDKSLERNPIDEQIAALIKADQHRKRQIFLIFLSLLFDMLLSLALAWGWHTNHKLAIRAESNHDAIIRSCETSNEARAKNKELWTYILSLPPGNNGEQSTPEQRKRVEQFKVFLDETFKQRDCQHEIK